MTRAKIFAVLALAAAPLRAFAGSEALSFGAEKAFIGSAFSGAAPAVKRWSAREQAEAASVFQISAAAPVFEEDSWSAVTLAGYVELDELLNRQLQGPLVYNLSGKNVWISGSFDRQQKAYISVLVEGSEPVFHQVRGLVDKEQWIWIGGVGYKLYVIPNILNQMRSTIVLENAADESDSVRVAVADMIGAIEARGTATTIGRQAYKVFYIDGIQAGRSDSSTRSFCFITRDTSGQIKVFMIPTESVPSDRIAIFALFRGARVGLSLRDGRLMIYDNL